MHSDSERRIILELARRSILEYLQNGKEIRPPDEAFLRVPAGAFVTLHMKENLRGCIGLTQPSDPLGETIVHCAVLAAVKDPRFPPLRKGELDLVDIEVSVLSLFRRVQNVEEIEVGIHGLFIVSGMKRGLLLPQVATEQQWDRDTFLRFTCQKAGLSPDAWKMPGVMIESFTAEVFSEKELQE